MKKLSIILAIAVILTSVLSINVFAVNVGDPIGNVLNSDIRTSINGGRIQSFNINGNSVILISDLNNYGFDVVYNDKMKSSTVTRNYAKKFTPSADKIVANIEKSGTVAFPYVYTDITAIVNGKKVESFNIKGYLAIYFKSLGDYGTFAWDGNKRESRLTLYNQAGKVPATQNTTAAPAQSTKIVYYKDFPSVPDFGAFSGRTIQTSSVLRNSIAYYYYGYDNDTVKKYCNLIESLGFSYRFKDDENALHYGKGDISIVISEFSPYNQTGLMIIDYSMMYDYYVTVPDFGLFSGAQLTYESHKDTYGGYTYNIFSSETINNYIKLLMQYGFENTGYTSSNGTYYYEDSMFFVNVYITDNGTAVFISIK